MIVINIMFHRIRSRKTHQESHRTKFGYEVCEIAEYQVTVLIFLLECVINNTYEVENLEFE